MKHQSLIILLAVIALQTSCNNTQPKQAAVTAKDTAQQKQETTNTEDSVQQFMRAVFLKDSLQQKLLQKMPKKQNLSLQEVHKLLLGTWIDIPDSFSMSTFKNNSVINIYNKKYHYKPDTVSYSLSHEPPPDSIQSDYPQDVIFHRGSDNSDCICFILSKIDSPQKRILCIAICSITKDTLYTSGGEGMAISVRVK